MELELVKYFIGVLENAQIDLREEKGKLNALLAALGVQPHYSWDSIIKAVLGVEGEEDA